MKEKIRKLKEKIRTSEKYRKVVGAVRKVLAKIKNAITTAAVATVTFFCDCFGKNTEQEAAE